MSVRRVELGGRWEAAGRPVRGALCHPSEVDVSSLLRGLVSGRPGQDGLSGGSEVAGLFPCLLG